MLVKDFWMIFLGVCSMFLILYNYRYLFTPGKYDPPENSLIPLADLNLLVPFERFMTEFIQVESGSLRQFNRDK